VKEKVSKTKKKLIDQLEAMRKRVDKALEDSEKKVQK